MRNYSDYLGDVMFPVIDFRRRNRYVNGEKTETLDSCYTVFHNYEKIDITVGDNGTAVTQQQIKDNADAGTPIQMVFKDAEIIIRAKSQWEIQASGNAAQAVIASEKAK